MRTSERHFLPVALTAVVLAIAGMAGRAAAEDAVSGEDRNPWAVFKFGFTAYKNGNKQEAFEAYRYAAEKGLPGARWKLAHMYASGDGVAQDDLAAFRMFEDVVREGAEADSPNASYVSDAHVALANYFLNGIPGTEVAPDRTIARDLYMRAATYYGNPQAQFELARMILQDKAERGGVKQAARWLQLSVRNGHTGAQALLGNLYFESGRAVRGLAMLTAALQKASPIDRAWIEALQERAFALANEADRRTAMSLAETGKASTNSDLVTSAQ